ncbi:MAG: hypothetical protein Q9218_003884 [Villophora microphyllina]
MTSDTSQHWAGVMPSAASWDDTTSSPDTAFATDPNIFESSSSSGSRKRKPPGSITPNACTSCKKARAKYEIHSKAVKEKLMSEIHRLRKQNQELMQENLDLGHSNDSLEEILRSLKNDEKGQEILHLLRLGKDHQSITAWLSQPVNPNLAHLSPESGRPPIFPYPLNPFVETIGSPPQHWIVSQPPMNWSDVSVMGNGLL